MRIGWDRPMGTFFAQVERAWQNVSDEVRNAIYAATANDTSRDSYGKQIEEAEHRLNRDRNVLWLGGKFDEYPEIEGFIEALQKEGYDISAEMKQTLIDDYQQDPPTGNDPLHPFAKFLKAQQQK